MGKAFIKLSSGYRVATQEERQESSLNGMLREEKSSNVAIETNVRRVLRLLHENGFREFGQHGSHKDMRHPDGRRTIVPVHSDDLKFGTARSIYYDAKLR